MQKKREFFPGNEAESQPPCASYDLGNAGISDNAAGGENADVSVFFANRVNDGSVKYFDLVPAKTFATTSPHRMTPNDDEKFSDEAIRNRQVWFTNFRADVGISEDFTLRDEREKSFSLLLFYFDQIVYMQEASEKFEKLENAVRRGDYTQLNSVAGDCLNVSINSGMFSLIEPLRRLRQIQNSAAVSEEKTDASTLCATIKSEFENFRFKVKVNLIKLSVRTEDDWKMN